MKPRDVKVVLCGGIRTPIGHFTKSLSSVSPEHLLMLTINALLAKTTLYPHAVDGVMAGWVGQGSHAPNIARIAVLLSHLPEKAHAVTVQANCVSGLEAISSAARHILMGEGDVYIAGGTESMSDVPIFTSRPLAHALLASSKGKSLAETAAVVNRNESAEVRRD